MPVPNTFANATATIPLSQLDANFATTITLGNTAIQLGNTVTTLNNMTLANVTISSGNVTITNVTVTTANVTTANITTAIIGTANVTTANATTATITTGIIGTANVTTANIATEIVTTSQTLSYGTANGVVYLNGSKVATSGSGLVFDGTNLGLGVTPSAWAGGQKALQFGIGGALFGDSSTPTAQVSSNTFFDGSNYKYIASAATSRFVQVGGEFTWNNAASGTAGNTVTFSERMRLDASGNLGIGTSSPSFSLDISQAAPRIRQTATTGTNSSLIQLANTGGTAYVGLDNSSGGLSTAYSLNLFHGGAYPICFSTNGTEKMRLDSAGNLGLGVTPSAWGSNYRAVEVSGAVNVFGNTGDANFAGIGANLYHNNTNYLYRYSTLATMYLQDNGTHQWHIAPSGTAGNAITFTQAMTLDASGNLILGGTSQLNGALLTVTGNVNAEVTQSILNTNTGASANARLDIGSSNYVNNELTLIAYSDAATGTLFGINKAKLKVIIDNVGVSAANSNGLLVGTGLGNPLYFGTNSTERVRIDASGYTQFSSNLVMPYQGAPTTKNAAATLSGAELVTGLLNTTGTTYTITLPTGTNIEGALTWAGNNVSLDWTVINTASGTITIGANGNTTLGSLTIATGTSAGFRIRRTAANTFTVYRMR